MGWANQFPDDQELRVITRQAFELEADEFRDWLLSWLQNTPQNTLNREWVFN